MAAKSVDYRILSQTKYVRKYDYSAPVRGKRDMLRHVSIFGIYCNKFLRGFLLVQPTPRLDWTGLD